MIGALQQCNAKVDVFDPWADPVEAKHEYGLDLLKTWPQSGAYEAMVVAVAHQQFIEFGPRAIRALGKPGAVTFDIKGMFPKVESDGRL
jgi:UDP-N-acetyl-D-galactosamine dehydrogenase